MSRRRRRAETEPTQPIVQLPRNGDRFYQLPMDVQRLLLEYVDAAEVRQ